MNTKQGMLLVGIGLLLFCVFVGTASAKTWYVDDDGGSGIDFTNIQDAVDAAYEGDTIYVYNGTYYEHISISKSLTLIGENRSANIIGMGSGKCVYITASNVTIEGFTVRNGEYGVYICGESASDNVIINNTITQNHGSGIDVTFAANYNFVINNIIAENGYSGIVFGYANNNTIAGNNISFSENGIYFYKSNYNILSGNIINANEWVGIELSGESCYNKIYNNSIFMNYYRNLILRNGNNYNIISRNTINGTKIVFEDTYFNKIYQNNFIDCDVSDEGFTNSWDNGSIEGGNYWSDHICRGNPSNGSQPYIIDEDNIDHYPFEDPNGWLLGKNIFDTGVPANPYPSIFGTHNGTIKPNQTITVNSLYTYPCSGTGGHTESIELYKNGILIANGSWNGYVGDWHNIAIHNVTGGTPYVTLLKNREYNYTIITGSYPQIYHNRTLKTTNGWINCTEFEDANGKKYDNRIPAIKLE